ncbi:MAG: hypothetical protein ABSH47_16815 [Bryobacteraceae bacterium]|jgi:hypothetical protein
MTTLICAGGSGTKVLESLLHLCAAGLGPEELRILVIDPDGANGNGTRSKELLNKYEECRAAYGSKMGGINFFRTRLDLLEAQEGQSGLKVWSPVGANKTFSDVLNFSLLEEKKDLVHLFFTDQELGIEMHNGFLGHPAIGAAAMSLLSLYSGQKPWNQLVEKIRTDVSQPEGSRVVIVGSVFGGTGASAIHPLVRFLRSPSVLETNRDRLKIAVVALGPYFQFKASAVVTGAASEAAAKSEWFALATRSAVQFYQHLREHQDWDFDAMYWLGDDSLMEVDYCEGGPRQKNPAHFVDLLAAVACRDFLDGATTAEACYYAGPRECTEDRFRNRNVLCWGDVPIAESDPEKRDKRRDDLYFGLLRFLLAGAAHVGFFEPLLKTDRIDQRPFCVPWYLDRFALREERLTEPENRTQLTAFSDFLSKYHFPWWRQMLASDPDRVRLFNRAAFMPRDDGGSEISLDRLANLDWPDRDSRATLDSMDRFFSNTVVAAKTTGGQGAAASYVAVLGAAADRFISREYQLKKEGS